MLPSSVIFVASSEVAERQLITATFAKNKWNKRKKLLWHIIAGIAFIKKDHIKCHWRMCNKQLIGCMEQYSNINFYIYCPIHTNSHLFQMTLVFFSYILLASKGQSIFKLYFRYLSVEGKLGLNQRVYTLSFTIHDTRYDVLNITITSSSGYKICIYECKIHGSIEFCL